MNLKKKVYILEREKDISKYNTHKINQKPNQPYDHLLPLMLKYFNIT